MTTAESMAGCMGAWLRSPTEGMRLVVVGRSVLVSAEHGADGWTVSWDLAPAAVGSTMRMVGRVVSEEPPEVLVDMYGRLSVGSACPSFDCGGCELRLAPVRYEDSVTFDSTVKRTGNALCVYVTDPVARLGLGYGDRVTCTVRPAPSSAWGRS